jgi:quercetin dioxygenase-like cupin family protein
MKKNTIGTFTKGWIVGDFEPSFIRTKDFEFGVKFYEKGDVDQNHFHKEAKEVTVVVSGQFFMNSEKLSSGDVVLIEKNEVVQFSCLESGAIAVVKTPSVSGDKYIVN